MPGLTPWATQPPAGTPLNRAHPLARRLTYFLPLNGSTEELVTGRILQLATTGGFANDTTGVSLRGTGSAACTSIPLELAGQTALSISFWGYWDAYAADDDFFCEYTANINSNAGGFYLDPNSSSGGAFTIAQASAGPSFGSATIARPSAAAWHHYVFNLSRLVNNGVASVYVDGASVTVTPVLTGLGIGSTFVNSTLYLFSRGNASLFGAGRMRNLAIRAGYALTQDEVIAEYEDPWALFAPASEFTGFGVSAGGGSYTLTAEQGSYTLTGQAAGLLAGRVLAAAQGSYTLSGQDAALIKGNVLAAAQGAYALTGQDVGLLRGLLLSAAQGSYALSGQDATLTYTPLGAFSLTADQGSYTLTGQSVSLLWGHVLAAGQGSYTLNGQDATLTYTPVGAYILTAGQGSYALTGQDVLLQWGHVLAAAQGSYTLTGQAATLSRGIVLAAAQGSYTLTGQAAAFARTYVLSAGYGSYALTGQIVSLSYSGAALEALEYLLLISHITQSMSKTSKVTMEVDLISRI